MMVRLPFVGLKKRCAANYASEQESRLASERILNEWLVYKNFLQLSVVGQMENMMAGRVRYQCTHCQRKRDLKCEQFLLE